MLWLISPLCRMQSFIKCNDLFQGDYDSKPCAAMCWRFIFVACICVQTVLRRATYFFRFEVCTSFLIMIKLIKLATIWCCNRQQSDVNGNDSSGNTASDAHFSSGVSQRCHRIRVPKSTPQDSAFLFRFRIRTWSPKFVKNRTRTRSHFSISAVAGVCVVISLSKSMGKLRLDWWL